MGVDCQLDELGSFIYRADVGNGLVEHEFDHLLIGHSELDPDPNPEEAIAWRRVPLTTLRREIRDRPEDFTSWLRIIIDTQRHKFPVALGWRT